MERIIVLAIEEAGESERELDVVGGQFGDDILGINAPE